MPAPGSCRICSHPERVRIEGLLAAGTPTKTVARQVGVPNQTLRDHVKRCSRRPAQPVAVVPAEALVLPDVVVPSGHPLAPILTELREIHGDALKAYGRAVAATDDRTIALLVQQLRNNLKAQADITAKLHRDDRPPEERLASNPEWQAFLPRLLRAVDRCCPGCRDGFRVTLEAAEAPSS